LVLSFLLSFIFVVDALGPSVNSSLLS